MLILERLIRTIISLSRPPYPKKANNERNCRFLRRSVVRGFGSSTQPTLVWVLAEPEALGADARVALAESPFTASVGKLWEMVLTSRKDGCDDQRPTPLVEKVCHPGANSVALSSHGSHPCLGRPTLGLGEADQRPDPRGQYVLSGPRAVCARCVRHRELGIRERGHCVHEGGS